jgi:predicted metal-dependent phosphoesterase TrpH
LIHKNFKFDLHSHSLYSDGLLRPAELVARAAAQGVRLFALTDHDETAGLAEARVHAARLGVGFVNGVEISASWGGQSVHIVGLNLDPEQPDLAAGLAWLRSGRRRRAESIAAELESAGIEGSLEGARARAANPDLVGRAHFARYLVDRGYAPDVASVFRRYLARGKPGYVPHQWASLEQAVGWIAAAGGVAVLAHPGRYRLDDTQRDALFDAFKQAGGRGVEVVSGSRGAEEYPLFARYATRYGLLASCGSDYHGPSESRCEPGALPQLPAGCTPIWSAWQ